MATATLAMETRGTIADLLSELGDIPADRVRLIPLPGKAIEANAVRVWDREKRRCELVAGTLVEKASGILESFLSFELGCRVGRFAHAGGAGFGMGCGGMFRLAPGLIRIPDFSYVPWERVGGKIPDVSYLDLAPDLAVEVISPGNSKAEMDRKLREYFEAGTRLIWYVYPKTKTVMVFTSLEQSTTFHEHETLDGGDVLPGFALPLVDLFAKA